MDIGHGTGSFAYATAEALMAAGRQPDVISTDLHQLSINGPAYDLPTMPEQVPPPRDVAARGDPRRNDAAGGDPRPGAARSARFGRARIADIALFRLLDGQFPLYDIWGEMREASRLLVNTLTIVGGRPLAEAAAATRPRRGREHPIWPAAQIPFTERQQAFRDRGHTPTALRAPFEELSYCTMPRAATGQRPSTAPSSTTVSAEARLIAGQMWFGTIATRSPTRTASPGRHGEHAVLLAQPHDVPVVVPPHRSEGRRCIGDDHPVRREHLRAGVDDDAVRARAG